jgi:type VI secretion system secreted protein VgrG
MADVFTLLSDVVPSSAKVLGFRGTEAISMPYRFDIALGLLPGVDLDMAAAVGSRATLTMSLEAGAPPRLVSGVLSAVELVYEYANRSVFLATLTPRLDRLRLTRHSRVFTDRSVVEILAEVLAASGLAPGDFELDLAQSYPKRHQVTQYKESNLAFLSRLLERDGIYYYFRQEPDREVLVITDHKSSHVPSRAAPAPYVALNPGDATGQEAFASFRARASAIPGRHVERDHDYLRPKLDLRGTAVADPQADEHVVVWGETAKTVEGAQRHAAVEAEALRSQHLVFSGWGRVFGVQSGFTFELDDHPRAPLNRAYLATAVEHEGNDSGGAKDIEELLDLKKLEVYLVTVQAIPADLQVRSPRRTPWPRVDGVVEGIVDGPAESPYAQIDEHGRYHVRLFFDESGLPDGKASMWVRMLQPHGGNPEGFHFPLRKGTEVAIVFLGGDPDRPAIVGAVPNPLNPSVVTSANHTQNVVMTGGSNRLEMEDKAGGQYVTLSSPTLKSFLHLGAGPYNFVASTEGNAFQHVGQNLDIEVLAHKTEDVQGSVRETYHDTLQTTVDGSVMQDYRDTLDVTVDGNANYLFKSSLDTTVNANRRLHVLGTDDMIADGAATRVYGSTLTEEVGGHFTLLHKAGRTTTVTGTDQLTVTGANIVSAASQSVTITNHQQVNAASQTMTVGGAQVMNVGSHQTNTRGPWIVYSGPMFEGWSDGDFKLTAAGGSGLVSAHATLNLQASGNIKATAVDITVEAGATVNISGAGVVNIVGGLVKINS